jgi:hypothetical protein
LKEHKGLVAFDKKKSMSSHLLETTVKVSLIDKRSKRVAKKKQK